MAYPSYALWSIWTELPTMLRLSSLILAVIAIYSLFSATAILVRLHSIMNLRQNKDVAALQRSVASLHARSANIRRLILATFYLFGIVFFFGLRFSLWTHESTSTSVEMLILENFFQYFAFAANAFFVFLVLHLVEWFVSGRLRACALRLNSSHAE
jgi:hypothetical protein